MPFRPSIPAVLLAVLLSPGNAHAAATDAHAGHADGVDFPISCTPAAQSEFTTALTHLHHMSYPRAREAFAAIAMREPDCAMAHWGVAMTLFQPLWPTRPDAGDLDVGRMALAQARDAASTTARERAWLASAGAFFDGSGDYWQRIARWEQAAARQHAAFPADDEATLQAALAHLATTPAGGDDRSHAERAAAMIEDVLSRRPDHPGAMHYLVHANDVPGREREALDVLRRYEDSADTNNPHSLHMPTHLYTRLGDWEGVIRGNVRAAQAALETPAGPGGEYVWDEFAHATEYLVYAHLQRGEDAAAKAAHAALVAVPNLEPSFKTAFHLASTPARIALERRDWHDALAIVPRSPDAVGWDRYPWPEAIQVFAHARGAQELGMPTDTDLTAADFARGRANESAAWLARLDALAAGATASGESLFERQIRLLRTELDAWTKYHAGDRDGAVAAMRAAVALEADTPKHPVTPAPLIPAEEQLGDLLLQLGRPVDALAAYERANAAYPGRYRALYGAASAAAMAGDVAAAKRHRATLRAIAGTGDRAGEVSHLGD